MQKNFPHPETTLAILIGASKWEKTSGFTSSTAFANAKKRTQTYLHNFLGLPKSNILDIFDTSYSVARTMERIHEFLQNHISSPKSECIYKDIIIYYIGHGDFIGIDRKLYLAIQCTNDKFLEVSGIPMSAIATVLKMHANSLRTFIILDCCYAGAANSSFFQSNSSKLNKSMSQELLEKSIQESFYTEPRRKNPLPNKGITLLCSSDADNPSLLMKNKNSTVFSQALLDTLICGNPQSKKAFLTLREVKDLAWNNLLNMQEDPPRPALFSPDQRDGDIADLPFFPNREKENSKDLKNLINTNTTRPFIPSNLKGKGISVTKSILVNNCIILLLSLSLIVFSYFYFVYYVPLYSQGSVASISVDNIRISSATLSSTRWVLLGNPEQYLISHQPPEKIGVLYTNGHLSDSLYSINYSLSFTGKKYKGVRIDALQVILERSYPIHHAINVWNIGNTANPLHMSPNSYESLFDGYKFQQAISVDNQYDPIYTHVFILPSGDTDTMAVHVISRIEADVTFHLQLSYHFYGEKLFSHTMTMPGIFEVMFIAQDHWHQYHFQDNHLVRG